MGKGWTGVCFAGMEGLLGGIYRVLHFLDTPHNF
jgi:hypothetical protein